MRPRIWIVALVGLLCTGVISCTLGEAAELGNVKLSLTGLQLEVPAILSLEVRKDGAPAGTQSFGLATYGSSISLNLESGTYKLLATLTPQGANIPSHKGESGSFEVNDTNRTVVSMTLTPVNKGVSVNVAIDDTQRKMPPGVSGISVSPSNIVYGGEQVTLSVQGLVKGVTYGWKAQEPIFLSATGGTVTTFYAPRKKGRYWVRLYAHDGQAVPAQMTVTIDVVKGGAVDTTLALSGSSSTRVFGADLGWDGSTFTALVSGGNPTSGTYYLQSMQINSKGAAIGGRETIKTNTKAGYGLRGTMLFSGQSLITGYTDLGVSAALLLEKGQFIGDKVIWGGGASIASMAMVGPTRVAAVKEVSAGPMTNASSLVCSISSVAGSFSTQTGQINRNGSIIAPRMAWSGTYLGVVWQESGDVYFMRLGSNCQSVGSTKRINLIPGKASRPDIAWDGANWVVVWSDTRDGNQELYTTQLTLTGIKIPLGGQETRLTFNEYRDSAPRVLWTGSEIAIAWDSDAGVFLARRQPKGAMRVLRISPDAGFLHMAYSGTSLGVLKKSKVTESTGVGTLRTYDKIDFHLIEDPDPKESFSPEKP